jgi:hypothetical protein
MPDAKKLPWKSQRDGFLESLNYMKGRMEGAITSLKTPWDKFNDATTDGIEWHTTTVIGARPGTGKTLLKDQLVRESFPRNPHMKFRVLEFQFEMLAKVSALREYSSVLGKPYKYLCSAGSTKLSKEDLEKCYQHAKSRVKYPIDIVEQPTNINELSDTIREYMKYHMVKETEKDSKGKLIHTPALITLDHTMLVKKTPAQKDKLDMLYDLGELLTELKRAYPIAFLVLSQLNRDINRPERNEPGKPGNYIVDSDIFGSDAMLQHADVLAALDCPGRRNISIYGPDRFIINDINILAGHFLKCRNGDTRLSFFKGEFDKMRIVEMPAPPMEQVKSKKVLTR